MNINRVDIKGFRAFSDEASFPLEADVVLFTGANGRGKTSVFDAILWVLTGSLPRLEQDKDERAPIVSLYASQARVALDIDHCGESVEIIRSMDESGQDRVSISFDDGEGLRSEEARHWLLSELWPEAQAAEDASEALSRALTRSVYLQQDLVRQFVEADSSRERFAAVSELVGAGRIREVYETLDRQRRTWKQDTNEKRKELQEYRKELQEKQAKLDEIGEPDSPGLDCLREEWERWWDKARKVGVERSPPSVQDSTAAAAIDEAMATLESLGRKVERELSNAKELKALAEQVTPSGELPNLEKLEEAVSEAKEEREEAERALEQAREEATRKRKEQLQQRERRQELSTLAQLALRHIEGRCPVCQQDHPVEETRQHLNSLIDRAEENGDQESLELGDDTVSAALERLDQAEETLADVEEELEDARKRHEQAEQRESKLRKWLSGRDSSVIDETPLRDAVGHEIEEMRTKMSELESILDAGEKLSLQLATVAQESRRVELEEAIQELERQVKRRKSEVEERDNASELADKYVDHLEDATIRFVNQRLRGVSKVLQRIYAKVDPHPSFKIIELMSEFSRRRGRLDPLVTDPKEDIAKHDPFAVMSSSQINVVALSIFLSLNLAIPSVPMNTLVLDDPLQSLDDINLLGFIDLVRRARGNRQMLLSTHDSRLADLFKRKLRPVREGERTRVFEFVDWSRQGPEIRSYVYEPDRDPMRIGVA